MRMSVIVKSCDGFAIRHDKYLEEIYSSVKNENERVKLIAHPHMFLVKTPYCKDAEARNKVSTVYFSQSLSSICKPPFSSKRKRSSLNERNIFPEKIQQVQIILKSLGDDAKRKGLFSYVPSDGDLLINNKSARDLSEKLYRESFSWITPPFSGGNNSDECLIQKVGKENYVIPKKCKFYCRDVFEMHNYTDELGKFDFIVLDPPWWNKYIRRKKAKSLSEGYKMMHNNKLKEIPVQQLLAPHGIVAVWCTNSDGHLDELRNELFPSWNLKQIACWTWLKVTQSGQPVCSFSIPPGKQPFEQLVLGVIIDESDVYSLPEDGRVFMSVPSAIHSHKPPLIDLMKQYLPAKPCCLEIFARYLLPHWTSWGLEVIKLQHISLFHSISLSDGDFSENNKLNES